MAKRQYCAETHVVGVMRRRSSSGRAGDTKEAKTTGVATRGHIHEGVNARVNALFSSKDVAAMLLGGVCVCAGQRSSSVEAKVGAGSDVAPDIVA
jgi:hypothetical protein